MTRPSQVRRASLYLLLFVKGGSDGWRFDYSFGGKRKTLSGHFDHVVSFLMDRVTLDAHVSFWGSEDKPLRVDLNRLTLEEGALYDDLRDNRIHHGLRLEQEHIGFHWLAHRLHLLDGTGTSNSVALR